MIIFDTIVNDPIVPGHYTETSGRRAGASTPAIPKRVTLVGQRFSGGTKAAGVPFRIFSAQDADGYAGVGSQLAEMAHVARAINGSVELWGIGLADDGAAVAASCTVTFAGTCTREGTYAGYVSPYLVENSIMRGRYYLKVTAGMTAAQVAAAWVLVVNADPYRVATAAAVGAVVTLTMRNAGVMGNQAVATHSIFPGEDLPTGITATITAFTTGATNPAMSTAIAALGDAHTTHLVNPYTDSSNLTAVENEMVRRWGGTIQRECQAFGAARGSLGTLTTLGDTRNSPWNCIFGVGLSPTPPWIGAAAIATIDATVNHPGIPLRGLPIDCMIWPQPGDEFDWDERRQLLAEGISTFTVDAGGKCYLERLVTTYQTNEQGSADTKYRDRQVLGLLFHIRYDWRAHLSSKYPRHMHAADGSVFDPGLDIVQPSTMKAELASRARNVWMRSQGWMENADQFENDIVIDRLDEGFDMTGAPDLINRFHISRTRFDFLR